LTAACSRAIALCALFLVKIGYLADFLRANCFGTRLALSVVNKADGGLTKQELAWRANAKEIAMKRMIFAAVLALVAVVGTSQTASADQWGGHHHHPHYNNYYRGPVGGYYGGYANGYTAGYGPYAQPAPVVVAPAPAYGRSLYIGGPHISFGIGGF
jgi:hypothetical protein